MRNTPPEEHVPVREEAELDLIAECLHPRRGGDQDELDGTVRTFPNRNCSKRTQVACSIGETLEGDFLY